MTRSLAAIATAAVSAVLVCSSGRASDVEPCDTRSGPALSVSLARWMDAGFERLVGNGLSHTIMVHAAVNEPYGTKKKLFEVIRLYRVRYYIWEDYFLVEMSDQGGRSIYRFENFESLAKFLSNPPPLVVPLPAWAENASKSKAYEAVVKVDLDPMSDDQLDKIHRHLANPRGSLTASAPGGASLFGTMAGLFVDRSKFKSRRSMALRTGRFRPGSLDRCKPEGGRQAR